MIIPISHENNEVKRLPWITFVIMIACLLIYISVSKTMKNISGELNTNIKIYFSYYLSHPYLEINSKIKEKLNISDSSISRFRSLYKMKAEQPDEQIQKQEQEQLDAIAEKILKTIDEIPFKKWGYTPNNGTFFTLISYMFLHGGWLHLFGNMLLLYLTGPYLEDVWGRMVYPFFYISAGVFSALMYALRFPDLNIPLVGASGAIAGLMGAFLIRFWNTRIKFFYFFFIIAGTFKAPAWIMLPLWFGFEAFDASQLSSLNNANGGVAHHAHIWGFIFGVAVALIIKFTEVEKRYLSKKIDDSISFIDKDFKEFTEVKQLFDDGKKEEAFLSLIKLLNENPVSVDKVELLWIIGYDLKRRSEVVIFMKRLIEDEIVNGKEDIAFYHYGQLKSEYPDEMLDFSFEIEMLKKIIKKEDLRWAEELVQKLSLKVTSDITSGLIIQFVNVASKAALIGSENFKKAVLIAINKPDISEEIKNSYKKILSGSFEGSDSSNNKKSGSKFKFYPAILEAISKDKIRLVFKNGESKIIPINAVKGISVARVRIGLEKTDILVDLFIDNFKSGKEPVRSIRLKVSAFDPLIIAPGARGKDHAVKLILSFIQKSSGAEPIPDIDFILLKKYQDFFSEEEYDKYLDLLLKS